MTELSTIQIIHDLKFYQVYKRNSKTLLPISTGRIWEDSKSKQFLKREREIKERADRINQKLKTV